MNLPDQARSKGGFPGLFFGLAYGISWLVWGIFAVSGQRANPFVILAGALAPSLVGVILNHLDPQAERRGDFWKRVLDFRRIGPGWYGVIFLIFPAILALSFGLNALAGHPPQNAGHPGGLPRRRYPLGAPTLTGAKRKP